LCELFYHAVKLIGKLQHIFRLWYC